MRPCIAVLALGALFVAAGINSAQDKKEVTLKGKITCNKCDLGKSDACQTVIVVKEKDKEVVYFFDTKGHKKYHGDTCTEAKNGSVTGAVKTEDKKKVITVSKVEYDK